MIWPFNRKQRQAKEQAREAEDQERLKRDREGMEVQFKEISEFVPIGGRFRYLGIDLVCIAHSKWEAVGWGVMSRPVLIAEYVSARGEIERKEFFPWMLPILRKENAKEAAQ